VVTTRRVRHGIVLALAGLLAGLGIVATLFWDGGVPQIGRIGPPDTPSAGTPSALADLPPASSPPGIGTPGAGTPAPDGRADLSAPPAATPQPSAPADTPRFDIVRVEPNGDAVVAGRGKPNTVVEMLVDGQPVAKALADPTGQFAIVPPPLPKGSSEIVLRSRSADGQETRSTQSIAVSVSPKGDTQPLVALTSPDAPTTVLSQPGLPPAGAMAKAAPPQSEPPKAGVAPEARGGPPAGPASADAPAAPLRIVSVDGEGTGRLFVTGMGIPGTEVRLYLNDTLITPAKVGADGRVTFTIGRGISPGRYKVRVEEVNPATGKVVHRAEVGYVMPEQVAGLAGGVAGGVADTRQAVSPRPAAPQSGAVAPSKPARPGEAPATTQPSGGGVALTTPERTDTRSGDTEGTTQPGAVFVPAVTTARITRGDNLWQISKRTYGRGQRYTVIYDANQDQIRDPDLIYPGQTFVLPVERRG